MMIYACLVRRSRTEQKDTHAPINAWSDLLHAEPNHVTTRLLLLLMMMLMPML